MLCERKSYGGILKNSDFLKNVSYRSFIPRRRYECQNRKQQHLIEKWWWGDMEKAISMRTGSSLLTSVPSTILQLGALSSYIKLAKKLHGLPDHQTDNQIDHIIIKHGFRSLLQDVKARRGADIGSDHHLIVAKIKIRLSVRKKQQHNPRVK